VPVILHLAEFPAKQFLSCPNDWDNLTNISLSGSSEVSKSYTKAIYCTNKQ